MCCRGPQGSGEWLSRFSLACGGFCSGYCGVHLVLQVEELLTLFQGMTCAQAYGLAHAVHEPAGLFTLKLQCDAPAGWLCSTTLRLAVMACQP